MDWWRKRKQQQRVLNRGAMLLEDLIECCDGKSNPIKFFSADEIRKATNNFSKSNHLSNLFVRDYKWYSGKNENHHKMFIKKLYSFHNYPIAPHFRDIAISSMVSGHKNFLKLVGCCLDFKGPVIVYDGVKKHQNLYDLSEQPWKRRMKIAQDIATALAYLHTAFPRPFVYRSLSLEKILLDEDGVAKLSDFFFCVLIPKGETFVHVDRLAGTMGYIDKKYMRNRVVSEETDVFAIGVLMQKLLMGHRRYDEVRVVEQKKGKEEGDGEDDNKVLEFMEEGRIDEIADPEMVEKMGEISKQELCQMKAFLMLSLRCISHQGEVPTMVEVAKELKKIQRSLTSSSPSGDT